MGTFETSATVEEDGRVLLAGVPFVEYVATSPLAPFVWSRK